MPKRIGAASLLSSSFQAGAAAAFPGSSARLHPACPSSTAAMTGKMMVRSFVFEVILIPA